MNEFARLRHKIYLERTGDACEDHRSMVEQLGAALFRGAATQHPYDHVLHAATLRRCAQGAAIVTALQNVGSSPYFDRYIADALRNHPEVRDDAILALRDLMGLGRNGPASAVAEAAGYSVRPPDLSRTPDPERQQGGIGTLLQELGSTMADGAGGVVTLVLYDTCGAQYPFRQLEQVAPSHSIVRVPVCLRGDPPASFLKNHFTLFRAISETIERYQVSPKIVHVRFLDDASLAAGRLSTSLGSRLVATITPDPHRQIDDDGKIPELPPETALSYFNKILIGDELVDRAAGILAIGKKTIERDLVAFYPQLENTRGRLMQGIDEGVRASVPHSGTDVPRMLTRTGRHRIEPGNLTRPTLLCVGRLASVKNQPALVDAWSRELWKTHNLVLVRGDLEHPSPEESDMVAGIEQCIGGRTHLVGKFSHIGGVDNRIVRDMHSYFASRRVQDGWDAYVCPSLKEEFGLTILEAMAAGEGLA